MLSDVSPAQVYNEPVSSSRYEHWSVAANALAHPADKPAAVTTETESEKSAMVQPFWMVYPLRSYRRKRCRVEVPWLQNSDVEKNLSRSTKTDGRRGISTLESGVQDVPSVLSIHHLHHADGHR